MVEIIEQTEDGGERSEDRKGQESGNRGQRTENKILKAENEKQYSVIDFIETEIPLWLDIEINSLIDDIAEHGSEELRGVVEEARVLISDL